MFVRDARGYLDNVTLHKGTIINPTGIRLEAGYPGCTPAAGDGAPGSRILRPCR